MLQMKKCAVCNEDFFIRDEDAQFYDQISPQFNGKKYLIPFPSLCPRDRECRRLSYRNERQLYKRKSSLSGQRIISFYHEASPYTVYSHEEWWSDNWDPLAYGRPYDSSKSFFTQFYELQLAVPRPPLVNNKAENSTYCNFADENKNSYLLTTSNRNEDSYYGFCVVDCIGTVDSLWCTGCELVYECVYCHECYNSNYCQDCSNCVDCEWCYDCKSCNNCYGCVGLRRKEFYIFNEKYTKEEYKAKLRGLKKAALLPPQQFEELKLKVPRIYLQGTQNENVAGHNIFNSKNVFLGFDVYDSENCAYVHDGLRGQNSYDISFFDGAEWCYESTSLIGYGYKFTTFCRDSSDIFYCDNCHGCKNCFGCTGLRRKEYCIVNKQYTKEEYEKLVPQIIEHMATSGEWGEFFPATYSMFGYNETLAQDYYPLTEKRAEEMGYKWMK